MQFKYTENGCRFITDAGWCGKPLRLSSSYCEEHHHICFIEHGSQAEVSALQRIENLAEMVDGLSSLEHNTRGAPTRSFIEWIEDCI